MERSVTKQQIFESLYDKYVDELFGFCVSKVRHREEAIDIVQEVFIRFWSLIEKGEELRNPRALLYAMVRNKIIDYYRSVTLQRVFPLTDEFSEQLADPKSFDLDELDLKLVLQTINTLDDPSRELLLYKFIDGMNHKQIGDILGLTENTVAQKISRSLKALRKKLATQETTT